MGADRILEKVLGGQSDAAIRFEDICALLAELGFAMRTRGSHHVFRRPGVEELINLQRDGQHAKPYQVRQVRSIIRRHRLTLDEKTP